MVLFVRVVGEVGTWCIDMVKTILLNGPPVDPLAAYGGGVGGYTRIVQVLLDNFRSAEFQLQLAPTTVRRRHEYRQSLLHRIGIDISTVLRMRPGASGIHICGQYRGALWREAAIIAAARAMRVPVLYHMIAGAFEDWAESVSVPTTQGLDFVMRSSKVILCEGKSQIQYVQQRWERSAVYFPAYIPLSEAPIEIRERFFGSRLEVCFVGFAYEGKGVFELVEGCAKAAKENVPITLTLVGREHPDFANWLDNFLLKFTNDLFAVQRLGAQPHDVIISTLQEADVFLMPTRHPGEGHTNAVNEALMMGCCVVASRHGFLADVLDGGAGLLLDSPNATHIADALAHLWRHPDEGRRFAAKGHERLHQRFTDAVVYPVLEDAYRELTIR